MQRNIKARDHYCRRGAAAVNRENGSDGRVNQATHTYPTLTYLRSVSTCDGSHSLRKESCSSEGSATADSSSSISTPSSPTSKEFAEPEIPYQSTARTSVSFDSSVLNEPIKYIKSMPSKNLRTQLIDCFQIWLWTPDSAMEVIKDVVDSLHQSSLILDDLEDGSQLRRGFPATHVVYGPSQAVNSATYLYVQAVESVYAAARNHPEMMDVFLKHLKHLFQGQSWDLYRTYHRQCPIEEQYLDMVDQKTGAMLQLLVGLMSEQRVQSGKLVNGDVLLRFAQLFGRYFQVRDDYMNLTSIDYARQKGFAEDLDEQKYSYLIMHMYQRHPQARDKFEGVFKTMKQSVMPQVVADTSKKYLLSILEETGSIAATKEMLVKWFDVIMEEIGVL